VEGLSFYVIPFVLNPLPIAKSLAIFDPFYLTDPLKYILIVEYNFIGV